ncbi:GNAT family N-acetyltransferase [Motilimonas eburnea]|uniref:GNAT family N-acetyltransferase n=1 Tax=Motilimonas eburnea TaxID=1737488 RepID=UPI001E4FB79E|nr:N-acetyltransferase [Motilimonas eburnea]MCE2572979.1 N-acetyltransferase [Motilimonas eburnea]
MSISIRAEQIGDIASIHDVTIAAFANAPHSEHTEQFIVKGLREAGALTRSLVAEQEGKIIGHVALSPVSISDGSEGWYGLGPISVLPEQQGQGVGSLLMQAAIDELKKMAAGGCVLLGDPGFYTRFGFKPLAGLELADVPPEYFLALVLQGEQPQGLVSYHPAFWATN